MSTYINAITGIIGGGKSSIAKILRTLGYTVLDADAIAKELLYGTYLKRVQAIVGEDIVNEDGSLNKTAIRERLLNDVAIKENLNAFTSSVVLPEILKRAKEVQDEVCFVEIATLFKFGENRWRKDFTGSIAVCCEESVALKRIMFRNPDIPIKQLKGLIASQVPAKLQMVWADIALDTTNMTQEEYEPWVKNNWPKRNVLADATL